MSSIQSAVHSARCECCARLFHEPLLITAGVRPASVYFRGGEVRVDAHDEWYLTGRKKCLQDLQALHPDTRKFHPERRTGSLRDDLINGSNSTFRQAKRVLEIFDSDARAWYATFGLRPPRASDVKVKVESRTTLWGSMRSRQGMKKEEHLQRSGYRYPIRTKITRSMALLRDITEQGRIA